MLREFTRLLKTPVWEDPEAVFDRAEEALEEPFLLITDYPAPLSKGDAHDYYSNADYWWPNPDPEAERPFMDRDGISNPDNFETHRTCLRHMRRTVAYLAAGYSVTGEPRFVRRAESYLEKFFLDEETFMRPKFTYAQEIPGVDFRTGTGIIDSLHLIDVAVSAAVFGEALRDSVQQGLKAWFADYFGWMLTSKNGVDEMHTSNNHAICFFLQAAVWARFTDSPRMLEFCREAFKQWCLPQMAEDGSFPLELKRTKPYGYSLFTLDNLINLAWFISDESHDFLRYEDEAGRSCVKALDYLTPFLLDKSKWPLPPDVQHDEGYPARMPSMLIAAYALGRDELETLYNSLPPYSPDREVRRNTASREPFLWLTLGR